ncbi:MAG: NAD(P)-binding domain-containing protein, partial [Chloroflexota bacterium]|nr:NAD(P)-binding domain-containing protein [Chloroflexota bacterium]
MDAARITAVRTAAVSGVAIRLFAAPETRHVAILGAGVQARSHLEVVAATLAQATVSLHDRHPERARGLAEEANRSAGREWVTPVAEARSAVSRADVVITVATLGASQQVMTADWLSPGMLVVAVDFATYVSAELARQARAFAVDDREQFLFYRANGDFDGYPEPTTTLGEALDQQPATDQPASDQPAPSDGRPVVVTHLGVGLADVLFADAVRRTAEESGAGLEIPR